MIKFNTIQFKFDADQLNKAKKFLDELFLKMRQYNNLVIETNRNLETQKRLRNEVDFNKWERERKATEKNQKDQTIDPQGKDTEKSSGG